MSKKQQYKHQKNDGSFLSKLQYWTPKFVTRCVTKSFFRKVKVIGKENLPENEPTIICANHSNQFMDAINLYHYLATYERPIKFLIAGKSYRRPVIGDFAKLIQAIPVERAQDLAKNGSGTITDIKETRIRGKNTNFSKNIKPKESISIKGYDEPFVVTNIISDEEVEIMKTTVLLENQDLKFKIQPKLDQSKMYNAVSECLNHNDIVGIFPEGGSSDRTDLLPLKAGVCIMALEAMIKNQKPVNIVCCGINYFKAHKFRSKVIIEVGAPYKIPMEYIKKYQENKREAIAELLNRISHEMRQVIYPAPSYEELVSVLQAVKIYAQDRGSLTLSQQLELNKRFSKGYYKLKDEPEIQNMYKKINAYRQALKNIGISDRELVKIKKDFFMDLYYMFKSLVIFLICFSFALPGVLLNSPVGYVLSNLAVKEREKCLKASKVKVKANDVVASHSVKLGLVFLPIYHLFFSSALYFVFRFMLDCTSSQSVLYCVLFFIVYPLYAFKMLRASDQFVRCYKNLRARAVLVCSFDSVKQLKQNRKNLQKQIQEVVDNRFVEIFGEDTQKIIKQSKIDESVTNVFHLTDTLTQEQVQEAFDYLDELGI